MTPAEAPADESAEPLGPAKPTQDVLLAVDIGGTTIAAGLVTTKGDLIDRDRLEIDHHLNAEALFDQLVDMLQPLLDRAKQRRVDCFMAYEPSPMRETARRRNITIADDVTSALDQNRMWLVLQPLVDSKTGKPGLYECLLRMEKPDGTTVSAGEFITVAEQLGLSRLIDRRTLELAVSLLRKHTDLRLSLNVSSLTASDHEWVVTLHRLTGGDKQITNRLTIEITETSVIHDLDQTVAFVDTLRELGCRVAIDDFGAGYTSFHNLKHLGADMVKIDGTFIKNLASDPSDRIFVEALVHLAKSFHMETVAEWVGDQASVDILKEVGANYLQGFHFGQPQLVQTDALGKLKLAARG